MAQIERLDAVRGASSLVVLFSHVAQVFMYRLSGDQGSVPTFFYNASLHAVLIFFLLSGHLITRSILSNQARNGTLDIVDYLAARVARIYPPLVGSILLAILVYALIVFMWLPGAYAYGLPTDVYVARSAYVITARDLLGALLVQGGMLRVNGPLWSLYIECHLYFAALLFFLALAGRKRWLMLAALLLLVAYDYWKFDHFVVSVIVWSLGALTAFRLRSHRWLGVLAILACAFLVAVAVLDGSLLGAASSPLSLPVQVAASTVYAWLLFGTALEKWKPPRWMIASADYSYSLYVIHFPLLLFALSLSQGFMGTSVFRTSLVCALATVGCISCAYFFARIFERQALFKRLILNSLPQAIRTRRAPGAG